MSRARDLVLCASSDRAHPIAGGACELAPGCVRNAGWTVDPDGKRGCTTHTADRLRSTP